ncbi:MAG: T9SS type A sorting domain-containing protein, partial [Bacteroidales bacterium]|nr:T9SS type A sorting domain-containing protein [Bacteroidales bacterium]
LNITVVVTNSQGVQMDKYTEMTGRIDMSSTTSHSFSRSYTVPNDSVYYLTVYIDHYDNYLQNDTTTIRRETTDVGIALIGESNAFTLAQNVPNPATNSTRIDYSVPEAGEVIFHVHSISGQLLYSKTIDTKRGTNSLELNTSTFAAGVYFYSMEYKGQRLVKQLIISN